MSNSRVIFFAGCGPGWRELLLQLHIFRVHEFCFSSVEDWSVGSLASPRWALRSAVFSSFFRFFSSLRARAVLARSLGSISSVIWLKCHLVLAVWLMRPSTLYNYAALPLQRRIRAPNSLTTGLIDTAWRLGKSESPPSLTNVIHRQTSRLNFFARITSAPMSFHFCADGLAALGTMWRPADQLKRRSSDGARVDGKCS
jgi:hypothetical protein